MDTEPENFSGAYPLAGERIGPAWREAWRMLSDKRWIEGKEIKEQVAARTDVIEGTVGVLLWKAEKVGILEKVTRKRDSRNRVYYRVAKKNLEA